MESDKQNPGSSNSGAGVNPVQAQIEANEQAREMFEAGRAMAGEAGATGATADRAAAGSDGRMIGSEVPSGSIIGGKVDGEKRRAKDGVANEPRGMAEINLAWKRNATVKFLKENKIVLTGVGAGVGVLVLALLGVVIVANVNKNNEPDAEPVSFEAVVEEYGEEMADSTIAGTFSSEITNRLKSDDKYTTEDAVRDFETAFVESTGGTQLNIAFSYAYFVMSTQKDMKKALEVLERAEPSIENDVDRSQYYSAIGNIYNQAGYPSEANYYQRLAEETVSDLAPTMEEVIESMEAYE